MRRYAIVCLLLLSTLTYAATRTTVSAGNWSSAGTWDTPPVDGDTCVIAHAVTLDTDLSGYSTGVTITINSGGSLEPASSAGTYGIKCNGHITVNSGGRLGPSSGATAYAVKWPINLNGARYIMGAGTVRLVCTEPDVKVVKLNTAASAGATTLDVRNLDGSNVDLSTGTIPWLAGEDVRVSNYGSANVEARVISSVSSNTVVLTVGLASAKAVGSLVALITRNVKVTGATGYAFSSATALTLACEVNGNANGLLSCALATITGGAISVTTYQVNACPGTTITGGVFVGGTATFNSCFAPTISGGVFCGESYVLNFCSGATVLGGLFVGTTHIINSCPSVRVVGGEFGGSTATVHSSSGEMYDVLSAGNATSDISNCSNLLAKSCSFGSTTENGGYNGSAVPLWAYVESIDHDQVSGAYKAWSKGGIVTSQSSTVPPGYSSAYQIALSSATYWGFYQHDYAVAPGQTLRWIVYRQQTVDASSKAEIVDAGHDPLLGGTALDTHTFSTGTGSWEAGQLDYTNSTTLPQTVTLRVSGMSASGTVYFHPVLVQGREAW